MQAGSRKPRAWVWPAIIAAMLLVHVTIWLSFAFIAAGDPSMAVEPDYYRKSLEWDAELAQGRKNRELGWSVSLETDEKATALGDREIRCTVRDHEGAPVEGADVALVTFPHARGRQRVEVPLAEKTPGVYAARARMQRRGLWEFRLTVRRGSQTFTYVELRDVGTRGRTAPWRR